MHTPTRVAHHRAYLDSERGWALAWTDPAPQERSQAAVAVVAYQSRRVAAHRRRIHSIERLCTSNIPGLDSRTESERRFP